MAFRYYTLAGASQSMEADPDTMGQQQFLNFVKGTGIADQRTTISDFDRLFLRSVRQTNVDGLAVNKGHAVMKQHQFVGALVRLASLRSLPSGASLGSRFNQLVSVHLEEHVRSELSLVKDGFSQVMESRMMRAVLHKHTEGLATVFEHYAGADASLEGRQKGGMFTVNMFELAELCKDARLLDSRYGARELAALPVG